MCVCVCVCERERESEREREREREREHTTLVNEIRFFGGNSEESLTDSGRRDGDGCFSGFYVEALLKQRTRIFRGERISLEYTKNKKGQITRFVWSELKTFDSVKRMLNLLQ